MFTTARTALIAVVGLVVLLTLYGCDSASETAGEEPADSARSAAENASGETGGNGIAEQSQDQNRFYLECDYLGLEPPGDEPVVFAPGVISTSAMEYRCIISPNGKEVFFTREAAIYSLKKREDGGWTDPAPATFSGREIDGESCLSWDGNRIYFSSRRPLSGAKQALNVWICDKTAEGWGEPQPMASPVNDQTVHALSVAENDNIYASGLIRLRFVEGKYLEQEKLTPDIKGLSPFVARDESFILFAKRQQQGYASDLFITFSNPDGTWGDPISLGERINTSAKESNPSISPDGKFMFFGRAEDIFWVRTDFIEKLRPDVREN